MTHETTLAVSAREATTVPRPDIPTDVRASYDISDQATVDRLSGGLVNDALVVTDRGETTVLRRLSDRLDPIVVEDTGVVSDHLNLNGWEAPSIRPTVTGDLHMQDSAGLTWHRMDFIASDGAVPEKYDETLLRAAGQLIGDWHTTTRQLDYQPRFKIPHFHDTPYHADKMAKLAGDMPDCSTRFLARSLVQLYGILPPESAQTPQIIHGDPKLDNMLFRGGQPFTLIDLDNVMRDSILTDVGDSLRSYAGKSMQSGQSEPPVDTFVVAYGEAGELGMSEDEAAQMSLRATGRIALELGMRYLCDIVDTDKYFSWDPANFDSRRDNHYSKATLQLSVASYALRSLHS